MLRGIVVPKVPINRQVVAVSEFNALTAETKKLEANYTQRLRVLAALKQSFLHRAFTGKLTAIALDLVPA